MSESRMLCVKTHASVSLLKWASQKNERRPVVVFEEEEEEEKEEENVRQPEKGRSRPWFLPGEQDTYLQVNLSPLL